MSDLNTETKIDVQSEAFRSIVADVMKQEAEGQEETRSLEINPDEKESAQPAVKGERVTKWDLRGFRWIQATAGAQEKDYNLRSTFQKQGAECVRQYMAMADSQRVDEMNEARAIVLDAHADRRIGAKAKNRILNLLDDPEERDYLTQSRGHTGLTAPSGEFLIPKPMLATIYTHVEEYGLAQRLATNITLQGPGNSLDLNSIVTAPSATWVGENALFTESDLALGQNVLTVRKLGAVSYISRELEEDKLVPLIPSWLMKIAENIALKIDQSWLIGDGTAAYGLMTGIANLSGVNVNTAGTGDLAPADINETDFRNTKRLLTSGRRRRAQWVMPTVLWDYVETFESTVGNRIVQELLTADAPERLIKFPVNMSEAMDNTDGDVANRDFAILGDYSKSIFGTKRGVTVETSTEGVLSNSSGVVTYNSLQQDGMIVKLSLRVGHAVPTGYQDSFAVLNAPAS